MSTDKHPPNPAANDEQSALANLKALLLGPEQASIGRLEQEVENPEAQTRRVAETLPEALHRAYEDSARKLIRALEEPVSECIEDSVQRNPTFFADILSPVMGPAIRRSINQALKGLVQQINQTLEHGLTLKGLKWRLEAARSGVPFGEIVLRNTLRYRVEDAFLIQNGSGLLIQHVSQGPARDQDADAVSAMLTAIREFAHDTLDRDGEDSQLDTIDAGEHTLWLVHGPRAYLACAIRGVPPVALREDLVAVIEQIHRRHGALLESFNGDPALAASVAPLMEPCLRAEVAERQDARRPWPLIIILLGLATLLAWWGKEQWQEHRRKVEYNALQTDAMAQLAAAPGVVLIDGRILDGQLLLRGLHDPLTQAPDEVLAHAGLAPADYRLDFRPFQSADRDAALPRARLRLAPPETVRLALDEHGTLTATGEAPTRWIERAALLATTVPGVERLDDSGLENGDQALQRRLGELLQPPKGVEIRIREGRAELLGRAPQAWIASLDTMPLRLPGLAELSHTGLEPLERGRLAELAAQIEQSGLEFFSGIELGEDQLARIDTLAALIAEAYQYAQQLGQTIQLQVIGRTDGTGTVEQNHFVATQRAQRVVHALRETGRNLPPIRQFALTQPRDRDGFDVDLRRVEFRLQGLDGTRGEAPGQP